MFFTILVLNGTMSLRAVIVNNFPVIVDCLTRFLNGLCFEREFNNRFLRSFRTLNTVTRARPTYYIEACRIFNLFCIKRCDRAVTNRAYFTCVEAPYGNGSIRSNVIRCFRRFFGERVVEYTPTPIILGLRCREAMREVVNVKHR